MVGRLVDGKGFEDLITAVDQLDENTLSVYLVGEGPLRSKLQREIEQRELTDRVHLLGYRDDIPAIMAASDVFVLPSYREGTPRVITEAMASGLPIIGTEIAGIPEQVQNGENGLLVQPGDIDGLTTSLKRLVESVEMREEFGSRSEQRIERFSIEQMISELDTLYKELVK
jgi:glycosyltransferase involved in cell wall biosynthesis